MTDGVATASSCCAQLVRLGMADSGASFDEPLAGLTCSSGHTACLALLDDTVAELAACACG